ncbi:hypothetical protein CEUSTIGMA_g6932.t1 [Chlamydomonas eustigma]|uniref:Uncharacterized protein n=1 Tax=Chlamydomonas eustigma TaxID=1157962 RepID=A0A250X8T8_9CHLO|nr:hypothetical protein CEUSTIGMA_g6932.t1 [Chlamydomonas eustigma]|eukprot:GAX79491.1 hypothetical protein CEUSTIGMA_g6932.t1 [Chlamydomonas eustigma]
MLSAGKPELRVMFKRNPVSRGNVNPRLCRALKANKADMNLNAGLLVDETITLAEVQAAARKRGMSISLKTLGPFYRIVCREEASERCESHVSTATTGGTASENDTPVNSLYPSKRSTSSKPDALKDTLQNLSHQQNVGSVTSSVDSVDKRLPGTLAVGSVTHREDEGGASSKKVLAVTTGFVLPPPFALMHCDTLQVFTSGMKGDDGQRVRGGVLGLGLLLGGAVFSYGKSCGASKAEILAINDDDAWHARLVKYYSYFGFKPVRTVGGNGLSDLPHMLVWGGEGTRMDADINTMLRKWTKAIRRSYDTDRTLVNQ